jgi:hypothetical protein
VYLALTLFGGVVHHPNSSSDKHIFPPHHSFALAGELVVYTHSLR